MSIQSVGITAHIVFKALYFNFSFFYMNLRKMKVFLNQVFILIVKIINIRI